MRYIVLLIIFAVMAANQVEKNRKAKKGTGSSGSKNVVPRTADLYQPILEKSRKFKGNKAFRESSAYGSGHMMNGQMESREPVIDAFTEFDISMDKREAEREAERQQVSEPSHRPVETPSCDEAKTGAAGKEVAGKGYGFSIFDDFAASDALYLARKDTENSRIQEIL